jgi:hypothetical protein
MKWLFVLIGLALIGAAGAGYVASIDLLTTEIGMVYATCAVSALCAGLIFLALGALTYRVDALRAAILRQSSLEAAQRAAPDIDFAPSVAVEPQWRAPAEQPVDEARGEAQAAQSEAATPTLVGRYSAGGASYNIFSDGSIEAQTGQGDFRFASMSEFKAFIAAKRE